MSALLAQTLGSPAWMAENTPKLKALLPATWTHVQNLDTLQIGFGLKLLGIDWRTGKEFGHVMARLWAAGVLQKDGMLYRAAP